MSESIDYCAAEWLLRQEQGLNPHEEAKLQQWLAEDPAHLKAWQDFGGISLLLDQLPSSGTDALRRQVRHPKPTQRCSRFAPQMAMVSCAMVVMVCSLLWFDARQPVYQQTFTTARGQNFSKELPDGSTIELDTNSRLQVTLYQNRREAKLLQGQAMFHISKNPERPFHVLTEAAQITVLGTEFAVRNISGQVSVAVKEGRVRVTPSAKTPVILLAGDSLSLSETGAVQKKIPPSGVGSWRSGRISFDNTPLSEALAEFERYAPTGLQLNDPALGRLRISGSFEVAKFQQFTRALPLVLPVRISDGRIVAVSSGPVP
jgi:transmembrane sensor